MKWFYVDIKYAVFGLCVDDNKVTKTAPIAKWMIGKDIDYCFNWIKNKDGIIKQIGCKMKKVEFFDFLKGMTHRKDDFDFNNDEVNKVYNNYQINRFVSMCELYLPLVNYINNYSIPKKTHYEYYKSALPKRNQFFKYIKKKKDNKTLENIDYIRKYFEIGAREAKMYLELLDNEQIKNIKNKFVSGVK